MNPYLIRPTLRATSDIRSAGVPVPREEAEASRFSGSGSSPRERIHAAMHVRHDVSGRSYRPVRRSGDKRRAPSPAAQALPALSAASMSTRLIDSNVANPISGSAPYQSIYSLDSRISIAISSPFSMGTPPLASIGYVEETLWTAAREPQATLSRDNSRECCFQHSLTPSSITT